MPTGTPPTGTMATGIPTETPIMALGMVDSAAITPWGHPCTVVTALGMEAASAVTVAWVLMVVSVEWGTAGWAMAEWATAEWATAEWGWAQTDN